MLNLALIRKNFRESRWLLAGCSLVIAAFCWVRVWLVSRLETERFATIIEMLPADWKKLSPVDFEWLITYTGRISATFDEPIVVFGVSIWAIAKGSDVVSGEISRGTMEMLLAQPVSRLKILFTQAAVTIGGVAILSLSAWGGIYAGVNTFTVEREVRDSWVLPFPLPLIGDEIPKPFGEMKTVQTPMRELVDCRVFFPAVLNLFSLGFFLAAFSSLVSACDRYRWRTLGIVISAYVVELIIKVFGRAVEEFQWVIYGSVFSAYEAMHITSVTDKTPEQTWNFMVPGRDGGLEFGPSSLILLLMGLGVICYAASAVVFSRRDLPAPL